MAQKVSVVLIDDIDGNGAEETVNFGLDGVAYEIDLNAEHAAALREALASYIGAGRKVGRSRGKASARSNGSASGSELSKADRDATREWSRTAAAKKAGIEPLGSRGRIPANVIEAWRANQR